MYKFDFDYLFRIRVLNPIDLLCLSHDHFNTIQVLSYVYHVKVNRVKNGHTVERQNSSNY